MVLKYFRSGLDFLVDQTLQQRDWISFLQMAANNNNSSAAGNNRLMAAPHDEEPTIPDASLVRSVFKSSSHSSHRLTISSSSLTSNCSHLTFASSASSGASLFSPSTAPSSSKQEQQPETEWRFWKWLPPRSRSVSSGEDYASLMASFKEYLRASESHVYTVNELKQFTTLELMPIVGYVDEYSTCEEIEKGSVAGVSAGSLRSYFIFKDGVRPLWEDEYNAAGGCWTLRITGRSDPPQVLWKLLIRILTDERMKPYLAEEICGAGLTIRTTSRGRWTYKISVWNRDSDSTIVKMMIGHVLKSLVPYQGRLYYYSHRTNMHKQQKHGGGFSGGGIRRSPKRPATPNNSSGSAKKVVHFSLPLDSAARSSALSYPKPSPPPHFFPYATPLC